MVLYGVEKMERNTEMFNFFVGRDKKGQAVFLPLVLSCGTEVVVQTGTERRPRAGGRRSPDREDWSGRFVRLPGGLGW